MLDSSPRIEFSVSSSRSKRCPSVDPASEPCGGRHKSAGRSTTRQCRERTALPQLSSESAQNHMAQHVSTASFQCSVRFQVRRHSGEQASALDIPAHQPAIIASSRARAGDGWLCAQASPPACLRTLCSNTKKRRLRRRALTKHNRRDRRALTGKMTFKNRF